MKLRSSLGLSLSITLGATVFAGGLWVASQMGWFDLSGRKNLFLVTSQESKLNGFVQTSVLHTKSAYRVNYRGQSHRLSTVAISESRDKNSLSQSHCKILPTVRAADNAIPFELSSGRGVVFNHQTLLANGAQTGWMQLLLQHEGTCVEVSAKGLSAGELLPQDLILLVSSLEQEERRTR